MTIEAALRRGRWQLEQAGVPAPRLTAEVLLGHVLGCERPYLYAHPEQEIPGPAWSRYEEFLRQRGRGQPTQYLTGWQEFYGRRFQVTPDVLIPRPETEHLVETALPLARAARVAVDAGCGSGAIAVTLALETGLEVLATDISRAALRVTAANARRLGASLRLVACDLVSALRPGTADLLVSNPPYVPLADREGLQREVRDWEPPGALFGGVDGLDFYGRLVGEGRRLLRPGGWLVMELGIRQLEAVQSLLGAGWRERKVVPDLAGLPRVLAARYQP